MYSKIREKKIFVSQYAIRVIPSTQYKLNLFYLVVIPMKFFELNWIYFIIINLSLILKMSSLTTICTVRSTKFDPLILCNLHSLFLAHKFMWTVTSFCCFRAVLETASCRQRREQISIFLFYFIRKQERVFYGAL